MKIPSIPTIQSALCAASMICLLAPASGQGLLQTYTNPTLSFDTSTINVTGGTSMIGNLTLGFDVGFDNHGHGIPFHTLMSPNGTTVILANSDWQHYGIGYNEGGSYILDDDAADSVTNPIYSTTLQPGTYRPVGLLSDFDGEDANGIWTLDLTGWLYDPNEIISWSLFITAASDATGSELIANIPGFGLQTVQPFLDTTTTHLRQNALRGPRGSAVASNDSVVRQEVSLGGMFDQVKSYSSGWEAWAQAYGEDGNVGTGITGYNYGIYGGAFGADRWINKDTLLGVFGGVSSADMDLDIGGAGVDVDSARLGVQGVKRWEKAYLLGSLHYGQSQYDGTRTTATGTAISDFDGDEFGAYIEMGFPIVINTSGYLLDGVTVQPLVAFQYTHVSQDGYTETGAGISNLVVGSQNESSERLSLGVLMTKDFETPMGTLHPYVEGRYTHEFNAGSQVVNSNFSGGGAVVSQSADAGQDFMEVRVGASLDLSERTSLYGGYEGRFSGDSSVNGAFAGVRVSF